GHQRAGLWLVGPRDGPDLRLGAAARAVDDVQGVPAGGPRRDHGPDPPGDRCDDPGRCGMTSPQTVDPRSAEAPRAPRTPPRALIKVFWLLHRGLVRASGGRVGLRRPESGRTMGMLRLTTTGRRSGAARTVILGYVPAGEGFATLAMNGW